jgi:hypothetical protein
MIELTDPKLRSILALENRISISENMLRTVCEKLKVKGK